MKTAGQKIINAYRAFRDRGVMRTNILVFLISAAVLILLFVLTGFGVNAVYNNAYRNVEYYEMSTDSFPGLLEDDFETLQQTREELDFVVFDENGEQLYATDQTMQNAYQYEDAAFIGVYNDDTYWNVAQTGEGEDLRYYVTKYKVNYDDNEDYYLGSAILDEDYTVIESDLEEVAAGEQMTWQQLEIMMETYSTGLLYKYEYKNDDGEQRTMFYTEYDMEYIYNMQDRKSVV